MAHGAESLGSEAGVQHSHTALQGSRITPQSLIDPKASKACEL
jgi:hypothetical protein